MGLGRRGQVCPLTAGVPNGEITTVVESQMIISQQRSLPLAAGPQGPRRPQPSPATPRRSAHRSPRRAGLTSQRGLGRRRRDGRRGAGGRPGHGPGPARRQRRRRRRFVSRAAGQAQPRECADQPKGGGDGWTVRKPRTHPFNPSQAAAPALAPPRVGPAPGLAGPGGSAPETALKGTATGSRIVSALSTRFLGSVQAAGRFARKKNHRGPGRDHSLKP